MLSAYAYEHYIIHCTKTSYVNVKRKNATDDTMTPNRLVSFVFISGIAVAVIVTLLLQYIFHLSTDFSSM